MHGSLSSKPQTDAIGSVPANPPQEAGQLFGSALLDRNLHAAEGRLTASISPTALGLAFFDWALHLANAPFCRLEVGELAFTQWQRLWQAAWALSLPFRRHQAITVLPMRHGAGQGGAAHRAYGADPIRTRDGDGTTRAGAYRAGMDHEMLHLRPVTPRFADRYLVGQGGRRALLARSSFRPPASASRVRRATLPTARRRTRAVRP